MADPTSRIRILHLEDNPRDAELIHDLVAEDGLACDFVRVAGRQAFESALAGGVFDVILADYNVPDYDGMSALKFAKQQQPSVPVIVISGSLGDEAAVLCLKQGATDYLLKDRLDRLGPALRRALGEAEKERNRRRAEAELRASEERMAAIFSASPVAISFGTMEGRLIDVNPEVCRLLGYERDEILGRTTSELSIWAEPGARAAVIDSLRKSQRVRNQAVKLRRKSGELRSALVSMEILRFGGEPMILTMIIDVTEQKALEAQLHHVQRVESIGRLASGIAHDMNNILAPIMMSAPLLRMGLDPAETETMLSTIEVSARRGAALVRQLLIFGRGMEGERQPVSPAATLAEITKIAEQTFPRKITIKTLISGDVWPVHGDATQLHQIMLNLCVNARDAMPDGGTLTLAAENVEIDEHYSTLHADAKPGRYVLMRVTDDGVGIPPQVAERIFDPFFTTKEVGKGTGLGLSTVLGIVKSHDGFVRLQSEPGRGSTFEVYLPASPDLSQGAPSSSAASKAVRGAGELIMVVDDEQNIRALLRTTLVRQNYRVVTAQDGVEATAAFAANPETRLIITDLDMPLMDGINLGRVLRRMNPSVKIIISTGLTGRSGAGKRQADIAALGVSAVLTKPYTGQKLLDVVQATLAETTPASG